MKIITINEPYILPTIINGIEIMFPYQIFSKGSNLNKDEVSNYEIKIGITTILLITWGYRYWEKELKKDEIIKLAFPFAIETIKEKYNDGVLKEFEEIILTTENTKEYPYDLKRIDKVVGYSFQIDNIQTDIKRFIETNQLADDIITTRDNINALMVFKFNFRLHNLVQERYILDLYRPVEKEEEFTHRISSLGNLIGDLNIDFLRAETGEKDKKKQSLDLLELFFIKKGVNKDTITRIIKNFRKLRKVRQSYPIHTDTVDGLIDSLGFFGIVYPITDYKNTWNLMLETYSKCLHTELQTIKNINAS